MGRETGPWGENRTGIATELAGTCGGRMALDMPIERTLAPIAFGKAEGSSRERVK